MWDTLWIGGDLATMAGHEAYGQILGGALGVTDGRISFVGPVEDLPQDPEHCAARLVDLSGRWVTPGLIDCHTHLVYGGNRALEFEKRLQGATYEEIARAGGGILSTVRATRKASLEELYETAAYRLNRLRREGVTTVEIKSGYGLDTATEKKMLQVARALGESDGITVKTTFLGAHAIPENTDADTYIERVCREMLPAIQEDDLADAVDAFCESIAFSCDQVRKVFTAAHEVGLPVKLHAEQLSDSGGAALAAEFGGLSADHLEYLSESGVQAMAQKGTVAVLLPGAFYFLRESQKPPVEGLRSAGVPLAIATDSNPGSSPSVSLLLMLNMAATLFRLTPEEALAGVTKHAAKALGMNAEIGTLEVGKRADLAIYDVAHPSELSYRLGDNPCCGVVKAGESQ